jgi:prophage DNA circulation protein
MADKPKTYPQKIQELQQQLEDALTDKAEAKRMSSFIPELQSEIADLKEQLELRNRQDQQGSVNSKSQMVDLEQRAISAEQGLRNLQARNTELTAENQALIQQLDIAGVERDRALGKEQKLQLLSEELKASNLTVATLNQRLRDLQIQSNEAIAQQEKEVLYLRQLTRAQKEKIEQINAAIMNVPTEYFTELQKLARNG